jgi:hypothetical protein
MYETKNRSSISRAYEIKNRSSITTGSIYEIKKYMAYYQSRCVCEREREGERERERKFIIIAK